MRFGLLLAFAGLLCAQQYDVVIRGGMVYDGSGSTPVASDIAISGDRIARVGRLGSGERGKLEVDAKGLAVAPGFINLMSGDESLWADGRSQSDIRQGV